jgi:hypothetical protein
MAANTPSMWTPQNLIKLKELWASGLGGTEIARELHTTRCAVLGKVHRMGFPKRKPDQMTKNRPRTAKHKTYHIQRSQPTPELKPTRGLPMAIEPIPVVDGGISILELENQSCRAIIGTGADSAARYCGSPIRGNIITYRGLGRSSYCPEHSVLYYQPLAYRR